MNFIIQHLRFRSDCKLQETLRARAFLRVIVSAQSTPLVELTSRKTPEPSTLTDQLVENLMETDKNNSENETLANKNPKTLKP